MSSESNGEAQRIVFDREAALAAVEGDLELMEELVELFLTDAPGLIEEIRRSVGEGDAAALRQSAHTLKGAVSNFHGQATVEAAFRLEIMGRDGDLGEAERALERLVDEFDQLKAELEKVVQGS